MIVCLRCGNENPDDNNFCNQCGAKFSNKVVDVSELCKNDQNPFEMFFPKRRRPSQIKRTSTSIVCTKCRGAGQIQEQVQTLFGVAMATKECPKCNGNGLVEPEENGTNI